MFDINAVSEAVEVALANFLGEDPTEEQVELVAHRVLDALKKLQEGCGYFMFENLVESSSTYVQTDLDELGLADYVGEIETQLEDFYLL